MEYRWKIDSLIPPMICRFLKIRGNSIRGLSRKFRLQFLRIRGVSFFFFFLKLEQEASEFLADGEKASRHASRL